MASGDIGTLYITGGVNEAGEAFCTAACHGPDGQITLGQLTTDEVRAAALGWLSAAEAADQDAATFRTFHRLELPDQLAGAVVVELRNTRKET